MRRACWSLALSIIAFPNTCSAIQLHWSSGSTDLTLSEATRCTLVVQADEAEGRLPVQWRLLWTADSAGVGCVPICVEKARGASSDGIVLKIGFAGCPQRRDLEAA